MEKCIRKAKKPLILNQKINLTSDKKTNISMKTYEPYEIKKLSDLEYSFTTDNHNLYRIVFKFSDRFFEEHCSECRDILEVDIVCVEENLPKDYRIGITVFEIFDEILSQSCNGIMYRCDDSDGRQCKRELQFDKWYEDFNEDDNIDRFAQSFCDENACDKYYVLVDKGCLNYEEIHDSFNYRCRECNNE